MTPDTMATLERVRLRLEEEYRQLLDERTRCDRRLRETEEELAAVARALDLARRER